MILLHLIQHDKRIIHKSEEQLEVHFYQFSTIFNSSVSFTFPLIFLIQGFHSRFLSFFEKEMKHEKIDHHHQHDIRYQLSLRLHGNFRSQIHWSFHFTFSRYILVFISFSSLFSFIIIIMDFFIAYDFHQIFHYLDKNYSPSIQ